MGKAARNEVRKLNATYCNSVAVGLTIAGYWVPAVAFVLGSYPMVHKIHEGGWSALDRQDQFSIVAVLTATALSIISARNFRHRAARNLHSYED